MGELEKYIFTRCVRSMDNLYLSTLNSSEAKALTTDDVIRLNDEH
jgi:hypothetical protein